jgi:hypothetical protein
MLPLIAVLLSLLAAQSNPSLAPRKTPQPSLPKIDENACPFEGCQFGAWTATDEVQLYSSWKQERTPTVRVAKGEVVTAVTGVHVTYEPEEIQITAPIADYGLKPGDLVFGYMNLGEGFFNAWADGYWIEEFDGSGVTMPDDSGCSRNCNAKLLKLGRFEWWVQIKTKSGASGWTKESEKFDGKDALGWEPSPRLQTAIRASLQKIDQDRRLWRGKWQ